MNAASNPTPPTVSAKIKICTPLQLHHPSSNRRTLDLDRGSSSKPAYRSSIRHASIKRMIVRHTHEARSLALPEQKAARRLNVRVCAQGPSSALQERRDADEASTSGRFKLMLTPRFNSRDLVNAYSERHI